MAEDTDQLRDQIDRQRAGISGTVDQIENRVNPTHVLARRQDRIKRRLTDWKDSVFGNDETDYPSPRDAHRRPPDERPNLASRVGDTASGVNDTVQHAPEAVRRQTRGNPMAAGAIALGAGWLIGSLLPESASERRAVQRIEPQLSGAADAVKHEAQQTAEELKDSAQHAADEVKQAGADAANTVKDRSGEAARSVKDQAGS